LCTPCLIRINAGHGGDHFFKVAITAAGQALTLDIFAGFATEHKLQPTSHRTQLEVLRDVLCRNPVAN
jgi:hypothetical protein